MALTAKKVYAILKRQISDMEAKLNIPVRYRGTVATADLLPLNPDIGDMYNIESKSIYGEAGMNVAWNGVVWGTMGAPIDISLYLTKEEAEEVIQRLVTEYFEKNPVKPGATTEQAQQIEQNKTDITSLKDKTNSLNEEKSDTLDYNNGVLRLLSGETELSRAIISDGTPGVPARIEKTSSDTTAELDSNKLYIFPEMSSLTYTLATPSDTSIANEYHFVFRSGATSTELVHPSGVSVPDGFTVEKNKVYEISILEGCLAYQSWAVI